MKTRFQKSYFLAFAAALLLASCRGNSPLPAPIAASEPKPAATARDVKAVAEIPAAVDEQPVEKVTSVPEPKAAESIEPVVAPAAEGEVALVDDTATQLLRERLSPPKQVTLAPPAGAAGPQPRTVGAVELLTGPLSNLPPAIVPKEPGVLPLERQKTPFVHPALDLPPLAYARDLARPETPKLVLGPRSFVASPDYNRSPHLERFARDAEAAVLPADDPSSGATARVVTAPLALAPPVLPPPQALSIPDPFERAREVELRPIPADADLPAVSFVRPLRPVLTPPMLVPPALKP